MYDNAYCRFCRQLIHYNAETRAWYHGNRRRVCNPPFFRAAEHRTRIATPSHRNRA